MNDTIKLEMIIYDKSWYICCNVGVIIAVESVSLGHQFLVTTNFSKYFFFEKLEPNRNWVQVRLCRSRVDMHSTVALICPIIKCFQSVLLLWSDIHSVILLLRNNCDNRMKHFLWLDENTKHVVCSIFTRIKQLERFDTFSRIRNYENCSKKSAILIKKKFIIRMAWKF